MPWDPSIRRCTRCPRDCPSPSRPSTLLLTGAHGWSLHAYPMTYPKASFGSPLPLMPLPVLIPAP